MFNATVLRWFSADSLMATTRTLGALALAGCAVRYSHLPPLEPAELWAPLPVQHVDVGGLDIAYVDSGGDGTPVVFIHGLSSWMGFWEYQIPVFAEKHRVLALDLPGYGASGRPDAPYTPPWYADVIDEWLGGLGIPEATLVGHSMGGQIAMTLALRHPNRVERLILSAPAGFERFSPGAARWMKDFWTETRALETREEEMRVTFSTMVFNKMDAGTERLLEERVRMQHTDAFAATSVAVSRSIAGMVDHPVLDQLDQLDVPTLIVFGTDDHMIPNPVFNGGSTRAIAETGRDAIRNSQLVLIPGAGHTVHHDEPDAFNAAVADFLRKKP